jgi:hypothetical protein
VSRHMGLFAVARLAERHRVRVRLRPAPPQGLSALVWLPDGVIERTGGLGSATSSWSAQPVGARARAGAEDAAAALTSGGLGGNGNGNGYANGSVGSLTLESPTASGWFRGGQEWSPGSPLGSQGAGMSPDFGIGADPGGTFGEPSSAGQTTAGLPVRVPRANMPAGAGGAGPPESQARPPVKAARSSRAAANGGVTLPKRSPEHARSRLAGFQRGTRRAEGQGGSGGQPPRAGEGTLS